LKIVAKVKPHPMKDITIDTDYIRLDAALKLADVVQSGGHAKVIILGGMVKVNGEVCTMRGKKMRNGDIASFDGTDIRVNHR